MTGVYSCPGLYKIAWDLNWGPRAWKSNTLHQLTNFPTFTFFLESSEGTCFPDVYEHLKEDCHTLAIWLSEKQQPRPHLTGRYITDRLIFKRLENSFYTDDGYWEGENQCPSVEWSLYMKHTSGQVPCSGIDGQASQTPCFSVAFFFCFCFLFSKKGKTWSWVGRELGRLWKELKNRKRLW